MWAGVCKNYSSGPVYDEVVCTATECPVGTQEVPVLLQAYNEDEVLTRVHVHSFVIASMMAIVSPHS